jgi:RHS repeat-associated protein
VSIALLKEVGGTNTADGYEFRRTMGGPFGDRHDSLRRIDNGAPTQLAITSANGPGTSQAYFLLRRAGNVVEAWTSANGVTWTMRLSHNDGMHTTGTYRASIQSINTGSAFVDDFGTGAGGIPVGPPPTQTYGTGSGGRGMHGWCACASFADPVNSRTGAFTTSVDDVALPGTGVAFAWSRSYTSADTTVGRMGPGWTDSYSASLAVQANGDVLLHGEDGQRLYYTLQGGSFVGAPGSLSTLAAVAGGYELRRQDQVVYTFNASGRLLSVKDRNAQGVTLGYDGSGKLTTITDAAGKQVTVAYNGSNLVSSVTTQDGRSVSYGYTSGRLTSVTDVRGKTWTYTYDGSGRLATMVDPLSHTQVANVYANGRVSQQTDALGKVTTFAWDATNEIATATDARSNAWKHDYDAGILAKDIDALSNATQLGHDADLNPSSVTSPTAQTTQMTYDAAGNLLTATAPPSLGSAQKTFVYNARNDPTQVSDARGKVTSYTYTAAGNVQAITQDGIQVAAYTYDGQGRVLTFTDGRGKVMTYTYVPASGYLESQTDPLGNKTTYTYDAAGRVLSRVDPKGNCAGCTPANFTWSYTYNAAGQQLTEQNPLGQTTTNIYDDAGRLTSTTDPRGNTTSFTYDDANRTLTETQPDPDGGGPLQAPVTTYTYDDVGNKLTETTPRGHTTTFAYDAANRLISETGPDPDAGGPLTAPVTTHTYDANSNLASTVEPRGNLQGANANDYRTSYTYDAAGRQLTTTDPLGNVSTNTYDPVGNLASLEDAKDHTTAYTYDAAGRILTVTAPDTGVTTYTYDQTGNVSTRSDALGRVTTYAYDDAGQLQTETSPDPDGPGPQGPAVTTHTHDPNGNALTLTDPNGNATGPPGDGVTTYGYDRANRLTSIDYSDTTPDVAFTYDAAGNRTHMTDGQGSETRTYDNLDRLLSVTRGSDTFSYLYDAAGNVTKRTYPGSFITDYTYDPLDRMATAVEGGKTTSYAYDAASNLTATTLPSSNGYVESRVYDRAGRLTEVKSQKGATILSQFVSMLDAVGNPLSVVRTGSLVQTQTYTYDANDRLTGVCFQAGTCPGGADPFIRHTYDLVGDRLTEQRPAGTTSYAYDALDRLLSAGSTSYTWDQNGNQLSAGTRTFSYDLANRLKSTTHGATTTDYLYDGDGIRVQASTGAQPSQKTNFHWDVVGGLPQLTSERLASGTLLRRYTYGLRRIAQIEGSQVGYFHYDALGSAVNVTASNGGTQWIRSYEPFGSIRTEQQFRSTGAKPTFMKFTGEYQDPTGLYHLRARQYDPVSGRFLQVDPAKPRASLPISSTYAYVECRPVTRVDPSGMWSVVPRSEAEDTAGLATSALQYRSVGLSLINNPPFPCQRSLTVTLDRIVPGNHLYVRATFVDEVNSMVRVSGSVTLRTTVNRGKIERHSFDVPKTRQSMDSGRWQLNQDNIVAIQYVGREIRRPIDVYGDQTYGRLRVTARHAVQQRFADCTYVGRFQAKR